MEKSVIVGMATIPERLNTLTPVLKSLHKQCDVLELALNGFKKIPEWISDFPKIKANLCTNEYGDANKFLNVAKYPNAYYFSCDDDIIYPWNYVRTYIANIKQYNCLVTIHGSDMPNRQILSYYKGRTGRSHCLNSCEAVYVDIAGSGVSGYDTSILKLSHSDFKVANMADIFMSMKCAEQGVKRLSIKHNAGWIKGGLNIGRATIYETHKNNDKVQTDLVNNFNWRQ